MNKLDARFKVSERGSTIRREIVGGTTTFATMAYILIVQQSLMASTGMNVTGVMIATALMSGVITLLMALCANLPFALAPAMGTNAIFAGLVASGGATWQQAMTLIVISGLIFLLLSLFKVREDMVRVMPQEPQGGRGRGHRPVPCPVWASRTRASSTVPSTAWAISPIPLWCWRPWAF